MCSQQSGMAPAPPPSPAAQAPTPPPSHARPPQIAGSALALCAEPGRNLTMEEYNALDDVLRGALMDVYESGVPAHGGRVARAAGGAGAARGGAAPLEGGARWAAGRRLGVPGAGGREVRARHRGVQGPRLTCALVLGCSCCRGGPGAERPALRRLPQGQPDQPLLPVPVKTVLLCRVPKGGPR